nr:PQQ-binding-like beta-propeller repeat protein [Streptomyces sp. MUSC 14]
MLYAGDGDRGVWAVDATSGTRIWLCDENTRGSQSFLNAGEILYGAGDSLAGGVAAIDAATGKVRWTWTDENSDGGLGAWRIALSGSRLLATNGPDVCGMPAV